MSHFVYTLRYNCWHDNVYKIGRTTNLDSRLKSYKTANGSMPDLVLCLELDADDECKERYYHQLFKKQRLDNSREHFILTRRDLKTIVNDGFRVFIGNAPDIVDAETRLKRVFNDTLTNLDLLKRNFVSDFNNIIQNYTDEFNALTKQIDDDRAANMFLLQRYEPPDEDDIENNINTKLAEFLSNNTLYKAGNSILMDDIRQRFVSWLGKDVKSLDNGTFGQVHPDYKIVVKKICKSCNNPAGKGCCDSYNYKNRTNKTVVQNIDFVPDDIVINDF